MVAIPPKPPTKTSHTTPTNTQRHVEHDQHSHRKGTRCWPFQATTGDFATIDPRHADDTPQGSAYGSNSPHRAQASTRAPPSQLSTRRNVGTESRYKPQPHQSQHQSTPNPVQKPHTKSAQATRSNRKPPQHTQHIQHTQRGAAASAAAPLPGSQPETRVT